MDARRTIFLMVVRLQYQEERIEFSIRCKRRDIRGSVTITTLRLNTKLSIIL